MKITVLQWNAATTFYRTQSPCSFVLASSISNKPSFSVAFCGGNDVSLRRWHCFRITRTKVRADVSVPDPSHWVDSVTTQGGLQVPLDPRTSISGSNPEGGMRRAKSPDENPSAKPEPFVIPTGVACTRTTFSSFCSKKYQTTDTWSFG